MSLKKKASSLFSNICDYTVADGVKDVTKATMKCGHLSIRGGLKGIGKAYKAIRRADDLKVEVNGVTIYFHSVEERDEYISNLKRSKEDK